MKPGKLGLEFGIALLLLMGLLLGAGWLTLSRMAETDSQLSDMVEGRWTIVKLANKALRYSSRNNRITMQIFLLKRPQDITPLLAERARNTDTISELLTQIEARAGSADEKKLLRAIWECRKPYIDSYKEALALLLDQGDFEKARLKMVNVTLPRLIDYHNAWEQFVQFQDDQMKKAGAAGKANFRITRERAMYLLGASVLVTSGIWFCVTLILTRPMRVPIWNDRVLHQARRQSEKALRA